MDDDEEWDEDLVLHRLNVAIGDVYCDIADHGGKTHRMLDYLEHWVKRIKEETQER